MSVIFSELRTGQILYVRARIMLRSLSCADVKAQSDSVRVMEKMEQRDASV